MAGLESRVAAERVEIASDRFNKQAVERFGSEAQIAAVGESPSPGGVGDLIRLAVSRVTINYTWCRAIRIGDGGLITGGGVAEGGRQGSVVDCSRPCPREKPASRGVTVAGSLGVGIDFGRQPAAP